MGYRPARGVLGRGAEERSLGSVSYKTGAGFCPMRKAAVALLCALAVVLSVTPAASASHSTEPHGIRIDQANKRILYLARDGELNSVTVTETSSDYVFTETGTLEGTGDPIPQIDNPGGGCAVVATSPPLLAGWVATCPKAGIDSIQVFGFSETGLEALPHDSIRVTASPPEGALLNGGGGNDDLFGTSNDDTILGGPGIDTMDGGEGNDLIDTGLSVEDPFQERFEQADGGSGFDTITYADRDAGITTDFASTGFAIDADGLPDILSGGIEKIVGSHHDDELIGGILNDTFVGNGGNDTMCGGLGVDTVDYSGVDEYSIGNEGVQVDLAGTLPTDERHTLPFTTDANIREYRKARRDCREIVRATGAPVPNGERDCTPNDGVPGVETDCVGEDVENIIGSPYDDVLVGNDPDALEGQGPRIEPHGSNEIDGGAGNDIIDGGFGPDSLSGDDGVDTVTYESRAEAVSATIDGAANDGTDTSATNFLVGDYDPRSRLSDSINGDVENLVGTIHDDVLRGDEDPNVLDAGDGADFVDGGKGDDDLSGSTGNDTIAGGDGADAISGDEDDDVLDGEGGDDDVRGDDGNDQVSGGNGADTLVGGNGADTLDYTDATTPVSVTLDGVNNDGRGGEGDNAVPDFEEVLGGSADDELAGTPEPEFLRGLDGDDTLDGGGGPDELSGGTGTDMVTYASRSGPVSVNLAQPGQDGEVDEGDNITTDVENVTGGAGDDVLLGDGKANVLLGGPGADRLGGAEGDDLLVGGLGADQLTGDLGNDTLFGSDGNDTLSGADGNDDLKGEAGDDDLDGGAGSDRHNGGPNVDTVLYSSRSAAVTVTLDGRDGNGEKNENDFINHDVESVSTGSGGDTIDADDNLRGEVKCGGGSDLVTVDPDERVDDDCETVRVFALGTRCTAQSGAVRMTRSGAIRVRVFCAATARGTLRLQSVARVRLGKGRARRIVRIGSRSFSLRAGQRGSIAVRASKQARRLIQRKRRLSVRARISSKATTQRTTLRMNRVLTVRAPR